MYVQMYVHYSYTVYTKTANVYMYETVETAIVLYFTFYVHVP